MSESECAIEPRDCLVMGSEEVSLEVLMVRQHDNLFSQSTRTIRIPLLCMNYLGSYHNSQIQCRLFHEFSTFLPSPSTRTTLVGGTWFISLHNRREPLVMATAIEHPRSSPWVASGVKIFSVCGVQARSSNVISNRGQGRIPTEGLTFSFCRIRRSQEVLLAESRVGICPSRCGAFSPFKA